MLEKYKERIIMCKRLLYYIQTNKSFFFLITEIWTKDTALCKCYYLLIATYNSSQVTCDYEFTPYIVNA